MRNQAKAIVACDFFISITLCFRVLYVFVAVEIGSRRILHCNVTAHPTAEWTTQQFREVLADVHPYRFVNHDHDSIFSPSLDLMLNDFGVRVLKTFPVHSRSRDPDHRWGVSLRILASSAFARRRFLNVPITVRRRCRRLRPDIAAG